MQRGRSTIAARPRPPIRFHGRVLRRLQTHPRIYPRPPPHFPRRHRGGSCAPSIDGVALPSPCGAGPSGAGPATFQK